MFKIEICCVGKTKEPWLRYAVEEYTSRLTPLLSIKWVILKDEKQLKKNILNKNYVSLDLDGQHLTSEKFSTFLLNSLETKKSKLIFVIGGSNGLSFEMKKRAIFSISLSKMTFTHQMTRLILLEQIYRSFEIYRGSKYHK